MQNSKKNIFLLLIFIGIIFLIVFGVGEINKNNINNTNTEIKNENKVNFIKIAGVKLKTELADTDIKRENGLSGRKTLKEDESMLFVFENSGKYSFWMKEMNFPIDMIWIGEDMRVVYIKKNATPESFPESFSPNTDAKYVLEVFSSFSEKNNLKIGDKVEFLSS